MNAILTKGHPLLEQPSMPVQWPDQELAQDLKELHEALENFRQEHGFGRAISAPQVGISKQIIALNLGATPFAVINPEITWRSEAEFEVWDDCLSVPDSIVRVRRNRSISLTFLDEQGRHRNWENLPEDMSELLQHEIDHLEGILMTDRAIDAESIRPISEHKALVGDSRPAQRLSLESIAEAAQTIDPVFLKSPQFNCESLSDALGCHLTLKVEFTNPIRNFKGRGADFFLSHIVAQGDGRELVCASAGNWGQAMAYACRKHGKAMTVYASEQANPLKIEQMRALGATVRLVGEDFDSAKRAAKQYCDAHGAWMVEDGLEAVISEGAGSIAVELLENGTLFESVLVPLGNGALLTGVARWFKAASPATRIIGVSSQGADAMEKSWRSGTITETDSVTTIADGIAVRVPIPEAVEDMKGIVDDVLLIDDNSILEAMRLLLQTSGLLVEPAGAAGIAAILSNRDKFATQKVATILTGSNLEPESARGWLFDGR